MAINAKEYPHKVENNLWANKSYTVFYYNFVYEKKRYRGLIDLSDKISWGKKDKVFHAKTELMKIKNEKRDGVVNKGILFEDYISKHFQLQPKTSYARTLQSHYKRYVSKFIGTKQLADIRQIHIRESIKYQEEAELAPRTVKQTIEVLAPVFKNAIADRIISFNPLDGIKVKLPKTKKIVTGASDELKKIHKAIYKVYGEDPFYLSIFLFAMQGRRRGEILTLKWEDINFEYDYYVLRNTKNNEEQKIFLPDVIKDNLKLIPRVNEWVFYSRATGSHLVEIRRIVDKVKRELNDDKFGIHYLRNVIVSAMAEQGINSIHLSGALGHNNPNTISKYLTMNYLQSSEMASGVIDTIINIHD